MYTHIQIQTSISTPAHTSFCTAVQVQSSSTPYVFTLEANSGHVLLFTVGLLPPPPRPTSRNAELRTFMCVQVGAIMMLQTNGELQLEPRVTLAVQQCSKSTTAI